MADVTLISLRREPGHLVRSLTALVLRIALGMAFLMYGIQKFEAKKKGDYPGFITSSFEKTVLGEKMPQGVKLFADVLPYAEVGVGCLLIAGFWTTLSSFLSGVLLLHLLFGQLILDHKEQVPVMFTYILINAAILWLSPVTSNYFSLDGLLFGWFWRPREEGRFERVVEER